MFTEAWLWILSARANMRGPDGHLNVLEFRKRWSSQLSSLEAGSALLRHFEFVNRQVSERGASFIYVEADAIIAFKREHAV
jgi:hypothetical protein